MSKITDYQQEKKYLRHDLKTDPSHSKQADTDGLAGEAESYLQIKSTIDNWS